MDKQNEKQLLNNQIVNGIVSKYIYENEYDIMVTKDCTFNEVSFIEPITFRTKGNIRLYFYNCKFYHTLNLPYGNDSPTIQIEKGTYKNLKVDKSIGHLFIVDVKKINHLNTSCTTSIKNADGNKLFIRTIVNQSQLDISNSVEGDKEKISIGTVISKGGRIVVNNCSLKGIQKDIGSITLNGCIIKEKLLLGNIRSIYITDIEVEYIEFNQTKLEVGSIKGKKIRRLTFFEFSVSAELSIENIEEAIEEVIIAKSDLINTSLFRCNLERSKFKIYKAKPKELEIDSVRWPNKSFVQVYRDGSYSKNQTKEDDLEERDFYRHLKIAAIRQEDKVNELKFYAFEMNSYYNYVCLSGDLYDRISLFISKHTNYFGLRWFPPVLQYFVITFIFYSIMYLCTVGISDGCILCMYAKFDLARIYNPTRSIEDYNFLPHLNTVWLLLDYVLRIIQGILIYQTISAFRKFFKT